MALFAHVKVTTIERDHQSYLMALDNVKKALMNDQIDIIFGDAHDVEVTDDDFDVIFIDAAKASYIRFFEKFKDHLKTGGIIISDNLLFRGMVSDSEQVIDKNKRQLVKKIRDYNEYIINHKMFDTCIYDIVDGISVSIKK
jgi:predicted O-methyltransferase YrrM